MQRKYTEEDLITIDRYINNLPKNVILSGTNLAIPEIVAVARKNATVNLTKDSTILKRIKECYERMMRDIRSGIPVYGCNTGFGAQASHILINGTPEKRIKQAKKISESIAMIDVGTGPVFEKEITRAAMLIRVNMLMKGVSAIKLEDLKLYIKVINAQITPIVNQYGGLGASGDLAHNARVLNALRQADGLYVWDRKGNKKSAKEALTEENIPALLLDPKAGLGHVNGDNFSSALATLLAYETLQLLLLSSISSAMMIEVLRGTNRSFHPMLSEIRPHPGQKEIAALYRFLLEGSKLAFQEMKGHKVRPNGIKVQDAYSLRCIQQYQSPNVDLIKYIFEVISINVNSASDNPLWVAPEYVTENEKPWQWISGGNFLAMHMAEAMDSLRKIMTQIVKLNDRHLARLVNPHDNNGLPANLSDKKAHSQCTFKGVQIQSGMYEVYASLLSIPVTTFFGIHEENNQDITSHALTSGILGLENIRLVRYSLAQNFIAIAQAVDLRGGPQLLSPRTRPLYNYIRQYVSYAAEEKAMSNDIECIHEEIKSGALISYARKHIFADFAYEQ